MPVQLLLWNNSPRGEEGTGHCALVVGSEYITWYNPVTGRKHRNPLSVQEDVGVIGAQPDQRITLSCLDGDAILRWWADFDRREHWLMSHHSSASVVSQALKAGGGTSLTSGWGRMWHTWNLVWTTRDVRRFAEAIQRG